MVPPCEARAVNDERIREVIADHLKGLITERGDGAFAHVSDCFGCDRATWSRRNGETLPWDRSPEMCLKMQLGVEIERHVCDGLEAEYEANEHDVQRDVRIAWNPAHGVGKAHFVERDYIPGPGEIVGHLDFLADDQSYDKTTVLEIKSTSFLKGRAPSEPSLHYIEQTATYGIAVGATHAGIIIVCRESGRIAGPFWLDLPALEFATIERAKAVLEKTSGLIPPPAVPRYSWQPRYCGLGKACACAASLLEERLAASIAAKAAAV